MRISNTRSAGAPSRELLTAPRTYYVRSDGSDSNTGLIDAAGGAFLTLQKALDAVSQLDTNLKAVTIKLGDGTYGTGGVSTPFVGGGVVTIVGNATTPANVVVGNISVSNAAVLQVESVRLNTASSFNLYASSNGRIAFSNVEFNTATAAHMRAASGGLITAYGSYKIVGAAPVHWQAILSGCIMINALTVTITGTPAFSTAFVACEGGTMELFNITYSGSATGKRYSATMNGIIQTYALVVFPGNAAGTTATGGQYA